MNEHQAIVVRFDMPPRMHVEEHVENARSPTLHRIDHLEMVLGEVPFPPVNRTTEPTIPVVCTAQHEVGAIGHEVGREDPSASSHTKGRPNL